MMRVRGEDVMRADHGILRKASGEWDGMPSVAAGVVGVDGYLWSYI